MSISQFPFRKISQTSLGFLTPDGRGCKPFLRDPLHSAGSSDPDLREEGRSRCHVLPHELFDPGSRNLHIFVLLQGDLDQIIEHRIIELLPPGRIGKVFRFLVFEAKDLRDVDGWALVIRAYGTTG